LLKVVEPNYLSDWSRLNILRLPLSQPGGDETVSLATP
jgi:hypothetical protein